jgi:acetylornithine/succinyldiaminopimelate/putrescine aminotransferase
MAQTSPSPLMLEVVRAEGIHLYDAEGNAFVDLISGIGVANMGHCPPEVVHAVQNQAASFMHTMVYGEYIQAPQVELAHELAQQLGPGLDVVYFTNSGAEATEGALKLSKKYTGRSKIVAFENSYHGSTHGALSVSGGDWIKEGYGPLLPHVHHIRFNSWEDFGAIDDQTACVIVEPVRGEAGIELPAEGYLKALRNHCSAMGTLLIFDEIQCGMGRTGSLFAHEQEGIRPDILLLAKALGGGMPIGAFISSKAIMQVLSHDPVLGHITTFGGHPVSCAAGLAAWKMLKNGDFLKDMPKKSATIEALSQEKGVLEVRGRGLMYAVELGSFDKVLRTIQYCLANGVVTDWFLHCNTAIRLAPPLVIRQTELEAALEILRAGIAQS